MSLQIYGLVKKFSWVAVFIFSRYTFLDKMTYLCYNLIIVDHNPHMNFFLALVRQVIVRKRCYRVKIEIRKKLFLKILISYSLIFIIPIALYSMISYISIIRISQIQDKEYDIQNLVAGKNSLDNSLLEVKKAMEQAVNRKWSEEYLYSDNNLLESWDKNSFLFQAAIKDLQNIKNSVKGIERIGIYFKKPNLLIDTTYVYNPIDYFKNVYKINNLEVGKWFSLTDNFSNFNILSSSNVILNNKPVNGITFYKTIPPNDTDSMGLVFCLVNLKDINRTIESLVMDSHSFGAIIDDSNKIISTSDNFQRYIPLLNYNDYNSIDSENPQKNEGYVYYSRSVSFLSWKLVLIKSSKHSYEYFGFSPPHLLVMAIIFIFGMIISFWVSKINYKPLERLFHSINLDFTGMNLDGEIKNTKNIYFTIKNALDNIYYNEKLLQKRIESYMLDLQKDFLYYIIGQIEVNDISRATTEEFESLTFSQYSSFLTILYLQPNTNPTVYTNIYAAFSQYLDTRKILFSQSIEHGLSNTLVYLIFVNIRNSSDNELKIQLSDFISQLENTYNTTIQMILGEQCSSVDSIRNSYKNELHKLKQQLLYGQSTDFRSKEDYQDNIYAVLPTSIKKEILTGLKTGDYGKIEESISKVNTSEILLFEVISVVVSFLEGEKKSNNPVNIPDFRKVTNLLDALALIRDICDARKSIKSQAKNMASGKDLKNELIDFIDHNYLDHNMSHKMIRDKFNISFALTTKIVKQFTGMGYLEYLSKKRLNQAKRLLAIPSVPISTVCDQSGFNDEGTLIKTFKKYENTTPSGYRNSIANR